MLVDLFVRILTNFNKKITIKDNDFNSEKIDLINDDLTYIYPLLIFTLI